MVTPAAARRPGRAGFCPRRAAESRSPIRTTGVAAQVYHWPMLDHVSAILFDLDGTVVDTVDLILAAHAHTFRQHLAGPAPQRRTVVRNMGRPLASAFREYIVADRQPPSDPIVE